MEINPELAKKLFDEGAFLIITGVPIGIEFGIDLCSYKVGERFRGVKMIPPGPHYIYSSSRDGFGDSGFRVGFLHYFKPKEILVKEWSYEDEELVERQTSDPELEKNRIRENLESLDRFLAAYDYSCLADWINLTNAITEEGVKKCIPETGNIRTNIVLLSCSDLERLRANEQKLKSYPRRRVVDESELLPDLKPAPKVAPRFTELPSRVPTKSCPSDISKHYMDCIEAVDILMENFRKIEDLIEEIQISFIMFGVGHSIIGLAHWRKILHLLSNSETAISKYKLFYMKYLEVIIYQLPLLPEDLMEQNDYNTVYKDIRTLLKNATLQGLSLSAKKLSNSLEKNMKWNLIGLLDENPEDLPVILEYDEVKSITEGSDNEN